MKTIKINYNDLEDTIKCYQKSINSLEEILGRIKSYFYTLDKDWEGKSKKKFYDSYLHKNLNKPIEDYIEHLDFLKDQLNNVITDFQGVENQYKNLKL